MLSLRVVLLIVSVAAVVASASLLKRPSEAAPPSYQSIMSAGPIEQINAGADLSCQATLANVPEHSMFPQDIPLADCGTFMGVGSTLYAPDVFGHEGTGAASLVYTPWTPASQTGVSGSGTAADPFVVTTVVDAGVTGLRATQVDSYVAGDDSYRTDVTIENTAAGSRSFVLYRAGNCFLGGANQGMGFADTATRTAGCSTSANNTPEERFMAWEPITSADRFFEGAASTLWTTVNQRLDLPDTCSCASQTDHAVGLSWRRTLAAGGSIALSHHTRFTAVQALTMNKTADAPQTDAGGTNGYTITVDNPNAFPVQLDWLEDELPGGFAYVDGSSSGAYTFDPWPSGGAITWFDRATVPAQGSVTQRFAVGVADAAGTYTNSASAAARGVEVTGITDAAPVTVLGIETPTPTATATEAATATHTPTATATPPPPVGALIMSKEADAPNSAPGETNGYTITITNFSSSDAVVVSIDEELPVGFTYIAGSSSGMFDSEPTVSGTTPSWSGQAVIPAGASRTQHFLVRVSDVPGVYVNTAFAAAEGIEVQGVVEVAPITVGAGPSATPTATVAPTDTATPVATDTPLPSSTPTPSATVTHSPTATATATHTPSPSATATRTNTATPTPPPSATVTRTHTPTSTRTATTTSTRTPTRTATPTRMPTRTATATPTLAQCPDVTRDGRVTARDLAEVAMQIGRRRPNPYYDINRDGRVNVLDLVIVVRALGKRC